MSKEFLSIEFHCLFVIINWKYFSCMPRSEDDSVNEYDTCEAQSEEVQDGASTIRELQSYFHIERKR